MRILLAHSAHEKGKPRVTVAGTVIDGILKLGVSRACPRDIYIRKRGNDRATGRALVGTKSDRKNTEQLKSDLIKKGLYAEFPIEEGAPVVPAFLEVANTIIVQHGGVVKERKDKVTTPSINDEEHHAISQHN